MSFQFLVKYLIDVVNSVRYFYWSEDTRRYQAIQFISLHSQETVGVMGSILR